MREWSHRFVGVGMLPFSPKGMESVAIGIAAGTGIGTVTCAPGDDMAARRHSLRARYGG